MADDGQQHTKCEWCRRADGTIPVIMGFPDRGGLRVTVSSLDDVPALLAEFYQRCLRGRRAGEA